ncbi:hypothetical protein CXB51_004691 [Gossypium anomalum]|uniref:Hemerythrin-like domain-containing protein n=1 Tax=Gossypium anomalum TaxID=47600 RepID=A0A8J5Z3A0_9ROSI|nr:hypothetical protein CXB51_004691 [Gossypium anomalum]
MGNCFFKSKKPTAEIAPCDCTRRFRPAPVAPTVRLYGSASSPVAAYIRFALLHKNVSLQLVPTEGDTLALEIGSETVSGHRETLLQFIEEKFPHPPLRFDLVERTPLVVKVTRLQHRSITWHLERMVRWVEDLRTRGKRKTVDPAVGSPRMELKKLEKNYAQLLEVMLEHAQMEERTVFPRLQRADPGLCKAANEEHARDLPVMNGIKEDMKSIGVMDYGTPACKEGLSNLSTRLKSLQKHCKEHFDEEEKDVLPLLEATELSGEEEKRVFEDCIEAMKVTHSHLFNFFLEGLLPSEAMEYVDLIIGVLFSGVLVGKVVAVSVGVGGPMAHFFSIMFFEGAASSIHGFHLRICLSPETNLLPCCCEIDKGVYTRPPNNMALWHAQNKFDHEGVRQTSNAILSYAQELEALGVCLSINRADLDISWDSPCVPIVNINFDASF